MSQSPVHKQFFISDLEWLVMTPVILQQFRMYYQNAAPAEGGQRPIGVVLWARVSAEVETMLERGTTKMRPQDWKSGDRLWVVEVIAPFGGHDAMVADLKAKVFPTEPIKMVAMVEGRKEVRVV
jgi:cytolysin-activating lysine-acyltransferase